MANIAEPKKVEKEERNNPAEGTYFSPGDKKPITYKGYSIKWLKSEPEHPDFGLVAEYEAKYGEVI
jgi:hypothetical protein